MGLYVWHRERRSALKERDDVVLARRRYLRQTRANRNPDGSLQRPAVYLDETFVNQNHSGQFAWYLEEDGPWVNKSSGKGPRLIIVHAMTVAGGVQGAALGFEAAQRTGEYHGQMNWENFSTGHWFSLMGTAKFLGFVAKLGEGSHIIIDPMHPEMRAMPWNCYDSSAQDATLLTFNIIRRIPQRITVAVSLTNVSTVQSISPRQKRPSWKV